MATLIIVGAQWGDEGKGKVTDVVAEQADVIVRYQGGNNAGHTVVVGDRTYKLHLIPSGIFYQGKSCLIGNGVVVDPSVLVNELDYLRGFGVATDALRISFGAHLIMPYHIKLDQVEETRKGANKIGTTLRGIGPAYMDKFARVGLRVADLLDADAFSDKLRRIIDDKNNLLVKAYGAEPLDYAAIRDAYLGYAERIKPLVADTSLLIHEALADGRNVLFEGAQGTLLDIDFGTYPYVTSSHPIAGGACVGAGIGPTAIDQVLGVVKAYTSRVGEGPFPTELNDETGDWIRERGHEFGTTTGRPRRIGWLDAAIVRFSARVSGLTGLAVTRLDTLGGLPRVKMCVGYRRNGSVSAEFPPTLGMLAQCEPVYEEFSGWESDLDGIETYDDLPHNIRVYLRRLEQITGIPVAVVSVGQERRQTIIRRDPFSKRH
ncbi:MAG: adenylosuccinate synthase [Chloroflexota bacterium]